MSNPDTQVNETPEAQPLNQEQQNTIKDINTLLANNNKEISTINDLLNKEFLKWISAELAWQILQSIPNQLKDDPNIQKVITVLSAKTSASQISWNNSNLEDYSNNIWMDLNIGWSIDIWNFTIDLSTYKKDISGNSELYWLTGLAWEIQQCLYVIGSSENLQNLKNNLEGIKKIIEGKSTKLNDLNKIEQFLINNQIRLESWNQNNIAPLLNWIHTFIVNTAQKLSENRSNQEQANRILNEEEQRINAEIAAANLERIERNTKLIEMSTAFSDIENKIPNDLWNLSKLNKKDIQNIKDFITESTNNNTISTHTNAKENVFILYLKMYRCQQALNGSGITHRDKNNFDEIFNHIKETFKNNEIQNYELWLQFKWINETNLKNAAPQNWDWKYLTEENNNSFLQTVCRWHLFQPKDYMDKFNNINENRVNNIVSQLQNYKISDFLQHFELNDNKDGLIPKNDKEHFNSLNENERTTALRGILTKQVASTVKNLVNWENEIKWIIWEYNSKENTNILTDWTNKIIEELNKQPDAPEWWDWNQEIEMTFEHLPVLDTNSIKKVFSNLNKQDIVNFFNEQKARTDLTGAQKTQLVLLYEGLTKRFVDPNNNNINLWKQKIETLQDYLKENDKNLVTDWKFGINTFNALRNSFDVPQLTSRPQTIKVEKRSENIPEWWEYQETFNNWTKAYRITNIKYLIDPNSFPENSCVKYNGITFHRSGYCYNENIWTNHDIWNDWNGTRYKMENGWILIHYEEFNQIQYISDNQKFTEKYDYDKIKNNYNLFIEILKTLKSDSNHCYSFDGNNIISNNTKSPRYYEKKWKLIKIDKSNSTTENHYYIRNWDQFVDMWNLISHTNYSSSYEILNQYKEYV